jgi:response regulator RpfG family c-di-GMP phosphodiesterase
MTAFNLNNLVKLDLPTLVKPLVMLVDDEIENRKVLAHLLADEFDVISANNGFDAIDLLEDLTENKQPQLVISDLRMDRMSGIDLLNKIHQNSPNIIRILLSGTFNMKDINAIIEQTGIFALVTKPIAPANLIQTIHLGLQAYQKRQQLIAQSQQLTLDIQEVSEQLTQKKQLFEQIQTQLLAVGRAPK